MAPPQSYRSVTLEVLCIISVLCGLIVTTTIVRFGSRQLPSNMIAILNFSILIRNIFNAPYIFTSLNNFALCTFVGALVWYMYFIELFTNYIMMRMLSQSLQDKPRMRFFFENPNRLYYILFILPFIIVLPSIILTSYSIGHEWCGMDYEVPPSAINTLFGVFSSLAVIGCLYEFIYSIRRLYNMTRDISLPFIAKIITGPGIFAFTTSISVFIPIIVGLILFFASKNHMFRISSQLVVSLGYILGLVNCMVFLKKKENLMVGVK
jgi:hypothetical protein